jgi:hypothetical protein
VDKPRIRSKKTHTEMRLPNYERLQEASRLDQAMLEQIALGLSTRNYEHSIQALCDGYGIEEQREPALYRRQPARARGVAESQTFRSANRCRIPG